MGFSTKKLLTALFLATVAILLIVIFINVYQPVPLAILSFTVEPAQSGVGDKVRSETPARFSWKVQNAKTCTIEGLPLFPSAETVSALPEGTLEKMTDDFSAGKYVLRCLDRWGTAAEQSVNLLIIPKRKVVMCQNGCGQAGRVIEDFMIRYLGETVQNIRACFGDAELACPSEDVTKKAHWTSSDTKVADWTTDYVIDGKIIAPNVYPPMTLKTELVGTVEASVTYNGYKDKLSVMGKIVGSQ